MKAIVSSPRKLRRYKMVLLIIITCAMIGYMMGESKDGVGPVNGALLGGMLGPIGLLILMFMGGKDDT